MAARIRSLDERVHALVNNAGIGTHGYFHETDLDRELEIIDLNVAALTHLTKMVLPGMLARKSIVANRSPGFGGRPRPSPT